MTLTFVFEIGEAVKLAMTEESGKVIGRAEYAEQPPMYFVRFVAADGRQVTDWFSAQAIRKG